MSTDQAPDDQEQGQTSGQTDELTEAYTKPCYLNWKTWLKLTIIITIVTFFTLAIIFNQTTVEILTSFLEWMEDNAAAGAFAFIGLYWFCTVLFIPGSLLTLGAGVVFRVVAGPVSFLTIFCAL